MDSPTKRDGVRGTRDYTRLTPFIHEVNQEVIRINRESKKRSVNFMNKVVEHVVKKLKDLSEPFRDLYKDTRRIGSFFDGTKVTAPSEFDVYIVLQFPFRETFRIERDDADPGFFTVQTAPKGGMVVESGRWVKLSTERTLEKMVDEEGYIQRNEVLNWWKSIFTQALHTQLWVTEIDGQNCVLRWVNSESGIKVHVTNQSGETNEMDIDMIPVLRINERYIRDPDSIFGMYNCWMGTNVRGVKLMENRDWYMYPKPLEHNDTPHKDKLWGLSFTDQEKKIIHDKQHLKPILRLLKRLRDNYAWKPLTSYCLKTIFLHNANRGELYRSDLGYLLIWFLSELEEKLQCQELPFFWDPDNKNLFDGIKPETLASMRGFVTRRLKTIHRLLDENDGIELRSYLRKLFIKGGTMEEDEDSSTALTLYCGATDPGYGAGSPYGELGYGSASAYGSRRYDYDEPRLLGYGKPEQEEEEGMSGLQKALLIGGGAAVIGGAALEFIRSATDPGNGSGSPRSGASTSSGRSQRGRESRIDSWGNRTQVERQEEEEMSGLEAGLLVAGGAALLGGLAMFFMDDNKKRKN